MLAETTIQTQQVLMVVSIIGQITRLQQCSLQDHRLSTNLAKKAGIGFDGDFSRGLRE